MKDFLVYLERQHDVDETKLKIVRTDGGGEFIGQDFRQLCLNRGLRLQTTHAYSPFENGIAERANRKVCDMASTVLIEAALPHSLWEYAVRHAVHLHNRVIHKKASGMTPYDRVYGTKPIVQDLPQFGEAVMIHIPAKERSKGLRFTPRAFEVAFIGFEDGRKVIHAYTRSPTPRVRNSRDYKFLGRQYATRQPAGEQQSGDEDIPETDDEGATAWRFGRTTLIFLVSTNWRITCPRTL
ncbi:hypothetical protein JG688_00017235 [Phytophthora aleatoria]|uniref:Integrase catalytic domain-containing protein n=1 Tax=Phytophthora aleatoria TaxID=2496075 RepID=A0A8J5IXD1_9STRA|nr:hypothetical protein JG688_00017235 [Phytophthora aleatoria]